MNGDRLHGGGARGPGSLDGGWKHGLAQRPRRQEGRYLLGGFTGGSPLSWNSYCLKFLRMLHTSTGFSHRCRASSSTCPMSMAAACTGEARQQGGDEAASLGVGCAQA